MRTGKARQDHLLLLEADNHGGIITIEDQRNLHDQWQGVIRMGDIPDLGHAALVDFLADGEAIDHRAGLELHASHSGPQCPRSRRIASGSGRPASRSFRAVV